MTLSVGEFAWTLFVLLWPLSAIAVVGVAFFIKDLCTRRSRRKYTLHR